MNRGSHVSAPDPAGDVLVGGFRGADRLHVDLAAGHHFRVPQGDDRSRIGGHGETHPAGEVLPEIHHRLAGRCGDDLHGSELLHPTDRLGGRIGESIEWPVDDLDGAPLGVIETGSIPAVRLEAGVVGLAVVDAVASDAAGGGAEVGVACR